MQPYRFNTYQFVRDLGGPKACWRRLRSMGVDITADAVSAWARRDSMNAYYVANLLAHEALRGYPIDIHKYIVPDKALEPVITSPPPQAAPGA